MKRLIPALLLSSAANAQVYCVLDGTYACYSDFPGAQVTIGLTGVPPEWYPLLCVFDAPGAGALGGTGSSGVLNEQAWVYGGAVWLTSSMIEGSNATFTPRAGAAQNFPGGGALYAYCPTVSLYSDRLETGMYTWAVESVDCVGGVFRLRLTDDAAEPGDLVQPAHAAKVHFSLTRAGGATISGTLDTRFVAPASLVFPDLIPGSYTMSFSDNSSTDLEVYCPTFSTTFTVPNAGDCDVNVALRAGLQGALPSGTVMTDALRTAGLVPTTEPYSALGYSYTGASPGATIPAGMLAVTGNDAIEDWVVVELRNAATPSQVVYSKAALIQRDGDVIGTDGDPYVSFPIAAGNYHVALRHRNHLGVMTASPQALGLMPRTVDFRSASTACYGTAPRGQVGSVYCLWSGDATGNGTLKYTGSGNDRDPILIAVGSTTPNNTVSNVYDRRDTNLDGVIKYTGPGNDRDIILTNVGSTAPNNTRTQQLP
jgi:hypothetical protein